MRTNCFELQVDDPNAVAICLRVPDWYKGRRYLRLAPSMGNFLQYKRDGDWKKFAARYRRETLSKLDPNKVYADLGSQAILLCWELPHDPCHRRLVAEWLQNALDIQVPESL